MSGKMVPIANAVSRNEALVLVSMLNAAGMIVRMNADQHSAIDPMSLAFGGYSITVPDWQHADASAIITDTFVKAGYQFSAGAQSAVIKLILAWIGSLLLFGTIGLLVADDGSQTDWAMLPLIGLSFPFSVPVNPQGPSDYFLES
jgi:hypothetical protein